MNTQVLDTAEGTTIALSGDLDTIAAQELDILMESLLPRLTGDVVVDLGELSYLNSTGIRSFIRLERALKPLGKRFVFVNVTARIMRIFQYCGLESYFTFAAPTAAAKGV